MGGALLDTLTFDVIYEFNCDITIDFADYPIEYELSSGDKTTNLFINVENDYCPKVVSSSFNCGD